MRSDLLSLAEPLRGNRVLVTGGAGFVGSHVVERAVRHGAQVRILDDLSTGTEQNLAAVEDRIEFVQGDIRDPDTCRSALEDIEFVIHLAGVASVESSLREPAKTFAVNVAGTANVFQAARDAGVSRIAYASSSSVYGAGVSPPHREGREGTLQSPYALSKCMMEQLALQHDRSFGMETIGLRYFNIYGPRQDPNGAYAAVIPKFIEARRRHQPLRVHGDGQQCRDFVHVDDVVDVTLLALKVPLATSGVCNVGTGQPTTILELARHLADLVPGTPEIRFEPARPDDIPQSFAEMTNFTKTFGARPTLSLLDGLRRLMSQREA